MKNINYLHPELQDKLKTIINNCNSHGWVVDIDNTLRTKIEQNILYEQGRMTDGKIVTDNKYPNNYHCWGLAVDIKVTPYCDEAHDFLYNLCEKLKLTFSKQLGLDYNIIHIEYPILTLKELRYKYTSILEYMQSWKNYNITDIVSDEMIEIVRTKHAYIEMIQNSCNGDKITDKNRERLLLTKVLDHKTLEAMSKIDKMNFNDGKYYSIVKLCQTLLNKNGVKTITNGRYTINTRDGIIKFQSMNGLVTNGLLSKNLFLCLISKLD